MIEPELLKTLLGILNIVIINEITPVIADKLRIQKISKYNVSQ